MAAGVPGRGNSLGKDAVEREQFPAGQGPVLTHPRSLLSARCVAALVHVG